MTFRDLCARAVADLDRIEGDPAMPFATAVKPWCAAWASTVLRACGVAVPLTWGAMELLAELRGCSIAHTGPFLPGDVVAWPRTDSDGSVIGGHVSIVLSDGPHPWRLSPSLIVVAGNSGPTADRVAISVVERSRVTNAARPLPSPAML